MILSFHPIFEGDINIICAGRLPDESDLSAIKKAGCVILPQGCRRELYDMARQNTPHVFPDYDARFSYPGKIGQIDLFERHQAVHPFTLTFQTIGNYDKQFRRGHLPDGLSFPLVFKFNWGGEGDAVFLIDSHTALMEKLADAEQYEKNGQTGFLIQEVIPAGNRVLRVAVIGRQFISYWRVGQDATRFGANLRENGVIDRTSDPDLQKKAIHQVRDFCIRTGINLAGFDLLFSESPSTDEPLFLEINYFFGRKGLGGSEPFYKMLVAEITHWIDLCLSGNG